MPKTDFETFVEFMITPAFGAQTKREIEIEVFRLLWERRKDWTLSEIAEELRITRARARSLVLEVRTREAAKQQAGHREKLLLDEVKKWPKRQIEEDPEKRLSVVLNDPFLRDVLKNFAFDRGISFRVTGEIVTFTWASFARLLVALYEPKGGATWEDLTTIIADVRAAVLHESKVDAAQAQPTKQELEDFKKELDDDKGKQAREAAVTLAKLLVPPAVKAAATAAAA